MSGAAQAEHAPSPHQAHGREVAEPKGPKVGGFIAHGIHNRVVGFATRTLPSWVDDESPGFLVTGRFGILRILAKIAGTFEAPESGEEAHGEEHHNAGGHDDGHAPDAHGEHH